MKRMWINQPSTLQAAHALHGTNVLVADSTDTFVRVYFLTGDTISILINRSALSEGCK